MQKTGIEWTDLTSNPVKFSVNDGSRRAWHCEKLSPGCKNCYAESLELGRFGSGRPFTPEGGRQLHAFLDEAELLKILRMKPGASAKHGGPVKIFLEDMSDLFGHWVKDEWLDKIFAVMALRPDLIFQVLTKRAERMHQYFERLKPEGPGFFPRMICLCLNEPHKSMGNHNWTTIYGKPGHRKVWPLPNVWLGVSVEDQARADECIPHLLRCPAAVRWLSVEPMLEWINIERPCCEKHGIEEMGVDNKCQDYCAACDREKVEYDYKLWISDLHWVVCGGESGKTARPFNLAWARSVRDQCQAAGVPFFMKQLGAKPFEDCLVHNSIPPFCDCDEIDIASWAKAGERPLKLRDSKGGDPAEWPEDLRVREFPRLACVLGRRPNFARKLPSLPRAKA